MGSRVFDGTNDILDFSGTLLDATTESVAKALAVWVKRARNGVQEFVGISGPAGATSHYIAGIINADNTVACRVRTTQTSDATSAGTITDTTTWHLLIFKWVSNVLRGISIDGGAFTTNTASRDPTTATSLFRLGATLENGPNFSSEFQGKMAYPCAWEGVELTDGNASSLWNGGAGVDPRTVQNAFAKAMWNFDGSNPEVDQIGAFDLTPSGTTFDSDVPFTIGTQINAGLQALSLSELAAVIGIDKNLTPAAVALALVERAATLKLSRNVQASAQSLNLIERTAAVQLGAGKHINASVQALNLIERTATKKLSRNVVASPQALALTGRVASVLNTGVDPRVLLSLLRHDENPILRM